MEEITGGAIDPDAFNSFLKNWQLILDHRIEQAIETISAIDGVAGLILAGSAGRNALWPLSDIDLLPIFEGSDLHAYDEQIDTARNRLMRPWIAEGWRSGIDIGRIRFTGNELASNSEMSKLIHDDHWFYGLDKAYLSRPVFDPKGLATALSQRLSESRFDSDLVSIRLNRFREGALDSASRYRQEIIESHFVEAASALRAATQWLSSGNWKVGVSATIHWRASEPVSSAWHESEVETIWS